MFQPEQILQQRYQLQRQLGRTARGHQTWLAWDLSSAEVVIVKLLAFSPQMRWEELKLFEREAKILETLAHPAIPRYRDYFDLDLEEGEVIPWFVLVQDYIVGNSLQDLLDQGKRFTEEEITSLASQILEILVYLHGLMPPVLHRDIKPSNLILTENCRVYLIDFGAVQSQPRTTGVTFTVVGTSGYAPLEQFWGKAVPASDLYALGATLIHLITGITPSNLPQKNAQIQFRDRVQIRPPLASWLEKLTKPSMEERFPSAQQALVALKKGLALDNSSLAVNQGKRRPHYTRIRINQDPEKLEIYIPTQGYRKLLKIFDPHFWSLETSLINQVFNKDLYGESQINLVIVCMALVVMMMVFNVPFILLVIVMIKLAILYDQSVEIYADQETLEIVKHSLGLVYGAQRVKLADILAISLRNYGPIAEVCLETTTEKVTIGQALRADECQWLISVLEDWLPRED